jgi:ubiquinone/menaquinone biosynthesis C-methylase UbiE
MKSKHSKIFICPRCTEDLEFTSDKISCASCKTDFKYDDGLPLLFWKNEWADSKHDVTEEIKSFYMETPFPNYDDFESTITLREKARKQIYARLLDEQIPYTGKILEIGCGTGQTCNLLAMTKTRTVFGTDISVNSLKLGNRFREQNKIKNLRFLQMNLFRPVFKDEMFDVVICSGVLHHTSDPFTGFQSISKLVKKGGYIIIGLYNKYGRTFTNFRRSIFSISGDNLKPLDSRLRDKNLTDNKKHTWFMDQYKNPHESEHTFDEILHWFEKTEFEFVNSIPSISGKPVTADTKLFEISRKGTKIKRLSVQLGMAFSDKEGGFYTMIARKK